VPVSAAPYADQAVFCLDTGVRLQQRYWMTAEGGGPYASPEAVELDRRVEGLRRRWPEARRFDPESR
jgi:hypothetical protein